MSENLRELFDKEYTADEVPERIRREYEVASCLKFTEERQVYLLRRKSTAERYILKCGSGKGGDFLRNEYEIMSEIFNTAPGFSSMLKPVDYFSENDVHYYIREYAEGKTLAAYIERNGALSVKETKRVISELCDNKPQYNYVSYRL